MVFGSIQTTNNDTEMIRAATAAAAVTLSVGALTYVRMNKDSHLSEKTKEALAKAIADKDTKTEKWIKTSAQKGYEGVGVIPYTVRNKKVSFVLGINKKNEAEYPGGKCEDADEDLESTVQREVREETGLIINKDRFVNGLQVTGGTTGYPSYVFLLPISEEEFGALRSPDNTFSKFIKVDQIVDCEKVTDTVSGEEYELRKFNRKYVIPQVKNSIEELVRKEQCDIVDAVKCAHDSPE